MLANNSCNELFKRFNSCVDTRLNKHLKLKTRMPACLLLKVALQQSVFRDKVLSQLAQFSSGFKFPYLTDK